MDEVLNCPFCGNIAHYFFNGRHVVGCGTENCRGASLFAPQMASKTEALVPWNTRAPVNVLSDNIKFIQPTDEKP